MALTGLFRSALVVIALAVLGGCAPGLGAPGAIYPGLHGQVTNAVTRQGIGGAIVSAQGKTAGTDQGGFYDFGSGLTPGTATVTVTHPAYLAVERSNVAIGPELAPANFQLQPIP